MRSVRVLQLRLTADRRAPDLNEVAVQNSTNCRLSVHLQHAQRHNSAGRSPRDGQNLLSTSRRPTSRCAPAAARTSRTAGVISKAFQGGGRAYLFSDVVNVNSGPTENRLLLTGLHVVADIYCNGCETRLGWKYVEAYEGRRSTRRANSSSRRR